MFPSVDMNISSLPNNKNIPLKNNRNYENNKKINKINNDMFPSVDMNISSLPNNKNIPLKKIEIMKIIKKIIIKTDIKTNIFLLMVSLMNKIKEIIAIKKIILL